MLPGETVLSRKRLGMEINSHVSDLKVLRSNGTGLYYIGTVFLACGEKSCKDCNEYLFGRKAEKGTELDYNSRETHYFNTKELAEEALAKYKESGVLDGMRT